MFKINNIKILTGFLLIILINSCKDIYDQDKYKRPEWLAGKLYTQLKADESLSTFTRCVEITGYDTILDRSGSFTIFSPNNEAFTPFFAKHPEYNSSVENIPINDLRELVRTHIIQDAWTLTQLQSLDIYGWIDPEDPNNNKPNAYKRQTLWKDADTKYWIYNDRGNISIVDSAKANGYRIVYTRSRKYAPIFFPEFFNINGLSSADYEFYYERPYESGRIHYANAKVLGSEVFAENGFIYEVDQVVDPILNVEQLLFSDANKSKYEYIGETLRLFPKFEFDIDETNRQPEAQAGLDFDSLYQLKYPRLPFAAHEELTGPNTNQDIFTLRYHNGFLAPNDVAFQRFIDDIIAGPGHWGSWDAVPLEVKHIVINNHMASSAIYQSDLHQGFYSGEDDLITIDEGIISEKYYGSNSTFIGLDEVIVPRALTSVSGPVYLKPGFSIFLYAMEFAKVLPAIKKADSDYSFFILDDNTLNEDSSLMIKWTDRDQNKYDMIAYDRVVEKMEKMSSKLMSKRLLNQVGISTPTGSANKEFIENLAGNYLIYNNSNDEVSGGSQSKAGYKGDSIVTVTASQLNEPTDNGKTYKVNSWLLPPNSDIYTTMRSRTMFFDLIDKAGLYNPKTYSFYFYTEGENYTFFVPSDQALLDYGADTLTGNDLEQFLKYHIIKGAKIFTDGKMSSGDYGTLRIDESSTPLFTKYTPMRIQTGPDLIAVSDLSGNLLGTINEDEALTNFMITINPDEGSTSSFDNITTSVLHDIDFVIHH